MIVLLIAAAIPSCKSPTSTTQSSLFTLILPDSTVAWGDSAVMRVVPAKSLNVSSVFTWTFGDSSSLVSQSDTIIHYYPDTGMFTVKVDLNDTSTKSRLGIEAGTVNVAARHFNLALLQSMPYVEFSWQSQINTTASTCWHDAGVCGSAPGIIPLTWNGTTFTMISNYNTSHQVAYDNNDGEWDAENGNDSLTGLVDINSSQIVNFFHNINYTMQEFDTTYGMIDGGCWTAVDTKYTAEGVPFIQVSDTDIVFEAKEELAKNASYINNIQDYTPHCGDASFSTIANFADSTVDRYVIIRFHK